MSVTEGNLPHYHLVHHALEKIFSSVIVVLGVLVIVISSLNAVDLGVFWCEDCVFCDVFCAECSHYHHNFLAFYRFSFAPRFS